MFSLYLQDGPSLGQGTCSRTTSGEPYRARHGDGWPSWRRPCGRASPAGRCRRARRSSSPRRSRHGRPSRRSRPSRVGTWARGRGRRPRWSGAGAGRRRAGSRRSSPRASPWPRPRCCRRSPPRWRAGACAGSPSATSRRWRAFPARRCRTPSGRPRRSASSRPRSGGLRRGAAPPTRSASCRRSGALGCGCATGSGQGITHGRRNREGQMVDKAPIGSNPVAVVVVALVGWIAIRLALGLLRQAGVNVDGLVAISRVGCRSGLNAPGFTLR